MMSVLQARGIIAGGTSMSRGVRSGCASVARAIAVCMLLSACLVGLSAEAHAQNVHVTKMTQTKTGTLRANVVAFERSTNSVRTPTSVRVFEGGREAGGVRLNCPPPRPPAELSSVLAVDISGSMSNGGPNISLAARAAYAWIDALAPGSECAVTAFDNTSFVASAFTDDKDRLRRSVDGLRPRGGTSFKAGFLHSSGGAMSTVIQGGKKRVVVFLTDGQGGGNADEVIAMARAYDVTIYCVTLGMPMPDVLRSVAENTGGLWFENVTTPEQAVMAYRRIFSAASQSNVCELEWNHNQSCSPHELITFVIDGDSTKSFFDTPDSLLLGVRYEPASVEAGVVTKGSSVQKNVAIVAKGGPITIRSVTMNGPKSMSVKAPSLPIVISAGDSIVVTVNVVGGDTAYAIGRVDVVAEPCPVLPLYVSSGSGDLPPLLPTIRVVSPNGRERFPVSSAVPLRYEGVPPNVPVQLEVSTNMGSSWTLVTTEAKNFLHYWKASSIPSDSCLLRASQMMSGSVSRGVPIMTLKGEKLKQSEYSADQGMIVTSGWEQRTGKNEMYGQVRLWDAKTGAPLRVLDGGYNFVFMPDGKSIITWGEKLVRRFDMSSGAMSWSAELTPTNAPHSIEVSRDGTNLLVVGGWGDSTILVDAATGRVKRAFPRGAKDIKHATMNADASLVAISEGDSVVRVYQAADGALKYRLSEPGVKNYFRVAFQPSGSLLAVAGGNGKTSLWDLTNGSKVRDIATRKYINDNTYIAFTPDGAKVALESDVDQTKIYEVASGKEIVTIQRSGSNTSAYGAAFSPNGKYLSILSIFRVSVFDASTGVQVYQARRSEGIPSFTNDAKRFVTVGSETLAEVHALGSSVLQQDVSDAPWSLESASGMLKSVRFTTRLVGQAIDSVVTDGIKNTGKSPLTVTSIVIEGSQNNEFAIRTKGSFIVDPGATIPIEYSFTPMAQGERAALVVAHTSAGGLSARITGRALNTFVQIDDGVWDIGTWLVGVPRTVNTDVVLRNTTDYPLTLTSFSIANNTDSLFHLEPLATPTTLEPGDRLPLQVEFKPNRVGQHSMNLLMKFAELQDPVVLTIIGHGDTLVGPVFDDPTTFRTIALPSSIIPEAGTITTGVYDVIGLQAGASITDNIMVIAGGAPPLRSSWLGADDADATQAFAYSLGVKAGMRINDKWTVAGGYQWGQSVYDKLATDGAESRITFNALYATVGYGNDDSRATLYLGYAFKRHVTIFPGTFDANATILAAGYDYRIARSWKLCSEIVFMRTMTFVPITLTARYFGETYALEAGLTILAIPASGASSTSPPLVPMLTWVKRW